MTAEVSIFEQVAAPAPRYLMRLALIEKMLDAMPRPPSKFLEIGPGMGDVSIYVAKRFPQSTGTLLDFSEESSNVLRERIRGLERLSLAVGDFMEYAVRGSYDLVIACEVMEHIEDDRAAFAKIASVLSPDGCLICSVPAFMSKWQLVDQYAGHHRRYERREIVEKLAASALSMDRLWCYGFPITGLTYFIRQAYYRGRLRKFSGTMEQATKRSGVERPLAGVFRRLRLDRLLRPFFWVQYLARDTDLGDGFIVLARRG